MRLVRDDWILKNAMQNERAEEVAHAKQRKSQP